MKNSMFSINALALTLLLAFTAMAKSQEPAKQPAKPAKAKAAAAPKSDEEIQKCISDKLAASSKVKADGITVTVASGVATLTGSTKAPGNKTSAGSIAKNCGAKSTQNNISVEKAAKPKTEESKPAPAKKP